MRKFLLLSFLFGIVFLSQAQTSKQVFESPNLKQAITRHKLVAILPFPTSISYRRPPKGYDAAGNKAEEIKTATEIQSSMYTYLLRKVSDYTVNFQDVDKTNILLKKSGYFDKIAETTKDSIAKILGVDAVISGTYALEHTKSEGGAIASTLILGGGFSGDKTATLTMTIHDGKDGDLLWRFTKGMEGSVFSSTDALITHMMRKVSRNFPYSK